MGLRGTCRRISSKFGLEEANRVYEEMGEQPVHIPTMMATLIGMGVQNVVDEEVAVEVANRSFLVQGLRTVVSNSGDRITKLYSRINSLTRGLERTAEGIGAVITMPAALVLTLFAFIAKLMERVARVLTELIETWKESREENIIRQRITAESAVEREEATIKYYEKLAAKYAKAANQS